MNEKQGYLDKIKKPTGLDSPLIYNIKDAIQKVEVPLRTFQVVQLLMADR